MSYKKIGFAYIESLQKYKERKVFVYLNTDDEKLYAKNPYSKQKEFLEFTKFSYYPKMGQKENPIYYF